MMNIYSKLQKMRVDLQNMNIKKSGENKFVGYKYYELGDILPPINQLMLENGVAAVCSFTNEYATLRLYNCEDPNEVVEFTSPMATSNLKGAHDIQNLGSSETYSRRYLYMTAFEVVENDYFDATQGKDEGQKQNGKTQQKTKPKADVKISEATANELNRAIREYAALAQITVQNVSKEIVDQIGKAFKDVDEEDAKNILDLLKAWTDFENQKKGAM